MRAAGFGARGLEIFRRGSRHTDRLSLNLYPVAPPSAGGGHQRRPLGSETQDALRFSRFMFGLCFIKELDFVVLVAAS